VLGQAGVSTSTKSAGAIRAVSMMPAEPLAVDDVPRDGDAVAILDEREG
jgi:hypothetical protein